MEPINISVKRLPGNSDLQIPSPATSGSAGLDLRAAIKESIILQPSSRILIPTGICLAIPSGYEGQIRPRSGLAIKHGIGILNSPGTVDSDYRGEIQIILINLGEQPFIINRGDRIAQLVISKYVPVNLSEVQELPSSQRSSGGFGHSGNG